MQTYRILRISHATLCNADFTQAEEGSLECIRPESSDHRPKVRFALLHDRSNLYLRFTVNDRYVRVVHTGLQVPVYKDSCVEFFVQPKPEGGYFNFEFNAGGAMQVSYIEDPERTPGGFKKAVPLPTEYCSRIEIRPSLPETVDPEITGPVAWSIAARIPFSIMEAYTGDLSVGSGAVWHGNFYKCGDETSHPHRLSWLPVKELNFHAPECFGMLLF